MADVQRGNILKALETTKEINTNDVLRSALVIDPGLSFSEGCEENACLENTEGNPEIEQTEAPVREEEEVFDRRDGVSVLLFLNYVYVFSLDLIVQCFTNHLLL